MKNLVHRLSRRTRDVCEEQAGFSGIAHFPQMDHLLCDVVIWPGKNWEVLRNCPHNAQALFKDTPSSTKGECRKVFESISPGLHGTSRHVCYDVFKWLHEWTSCPLG